MAVSFPNIYPTLKRLLKYTLNNNNVPGDSDTVLKKNATVYLIHTDIQGAHIFL